MSISCVAARSMSFRKARGKRKVVSSDAAGELRLAYIVYHSLLLRLPVLWPLLCFFAFSYIRLPPLHMQQTFHPGQLQDAQVPGQVIEEHIHSTCLQLQAEGIVFAEQLAPALQKRFL